MEQNESGLPPLIEIGVIDTSKIGNDLDRLHSEIERDLMSNYMGYSVPLTEIHQRIRTTVEAEMYEFPFFEQAELVARLIAIDRGMPGLVNIDDPELRSPQGVEFRFGAAFAISAVNQDLRHKGFEYDSERHDCRPKLMDDINQEIADAIVLYPDDRESPVVSGERLIDEADASALCDLALGAAGLHYEAHQEYWYPILEPHAELFMPPNKPEQHLALYGIGFGLALMEGLKPAIDDAYVSSFRLRLAELDEKGIAGVFDNR